MTAKQLDKAIAKNLKVRVRDVRPIRRELCRILMGVASKSGVAGVYITALNGAEEGGA